MAKTLLEQLNEMTVVVADSGDFESIEQFKPQDTTTNPSLLTAAAGMPQYQPIVDGVLLEARKQLGPKPKTRMSPISPSVTWLSLLERKFSPSFPAGFRLRWMRGSL